jgi:uncharacterized RDD family membrane protein YckC
MNVYTIQTPLNITLNFQIANLGRRLLAWLIDFLALYAFNLVFGIFIFTDLANINIKSITSMGMLEILLIILLIIPSTLYHMLSQLMWNGYTLGKYVMKIKVVNKNDGGAASSQQIIIRNLFSVSNIILGMTFIAINPIILIPFFFTLSIVCIPDIISILAQKESQKIGDLLAGTMVIATNYQPDIEATIFKDINIDANYNVTYPFAIRLSDNEINGLNNMIKNPSFYTKDYIDKIAHRIAEKLNTEIKEPSHLDFFESIIHDYNYLHLQKHL